MHARDPTMQLLARDGTSRLHMCSVRPRKLSSAAPLGLQSSETLDSVSWYVEMNSLGGLWGTQVGCTIDYRGGAKY
jgi:hypothetical protein